MKKSEQCPKCDSRHIYLVEQACSPNYEFRNSVEPLMLFAHYMPERERLGVTFEVHICGNCGYSEIYATAPHNLRRFAAEGLIREKRG